MTITRDQVNRSIFVTGLPSGDFQTEDLVELLEGGGAIETYTRGDKCLGVVFKSIEGRDNSLIFNDYPLEFDGETYAIQVMEMLDENLLQLPHEEKEENPALAKKKKEKDDEWTVVEENKKDEEQQEEQQEGQAIQNRVEEVETLMDSLIPHKIEKEEVEIERGRARSNNIMNVMNLEKFASVETKEDVQPVEVVDEIEKIENTKKTVLQELVTESHIIQEISEVKTNIETKLVFDSNISVHKPSEIQRPDNIGISAIKVNEDEKPRIRNPARPTREDILSKSNPQIVVKTQNNPLSLVMNLECKKDVITKSLLIICALVLIINAFILIVF